MQITMTVKLLGGNFLLHVRLRINRIGISTEWVNFLPPHLVKKDVMVNGELDI